MSRRKVILRSVEVGILSVIMGVLLASAWRGSIYSEATRVEEILLQYVPGISGGGIQLVSMFVLGLFFTWALLYAQDVKKSLQGYILIIGGVLTVVMMALFDTLLPQMDVTLQNGIALLAGIGVALGSEAFKTPFHAETPALLEIDFSKSSFGHAVRNGVNNADATFPVAARGIYALVVSIIIFANAALVASEGPVEVIFATVFVSGIFGWRFHRFIHLDDPPEREHDVEILGPRGSGKTLFLYGLYLTVDDDDTEYEYSGSNSEWSEQTTEIRSGRTDPMTPWGVTSTSNPVYYSFNFVSTEGFYERIQISLTDFPGGWVDQLAEQAETENESSESAAVATDGGQSDDSMGWAPSSSDDEEAQDDPLTDIEGIGQEAAEELRDNGVQTPSDLESMSSSELEEFATIGAASATQIKDEVGGENNEVDVGSSSSETEDSAQGAVGQVAGLRTEFQQSQTMIVLLDSKAAVDEGMLPIDDIKLKGTEPGETEGDSKVVKMRQILGDVNPDRVILVATKADFLIPAYMDEKNPKDPPHEELGDFEEFSDWVNEKFDVPPFSDLKANENVDAIHPVYYQSNRQENGDLEPAIENGLMQPEGYERIIDEIIKR